jgi:MFS family permease
MKNKIFITIGIGTLLMLLLGIVYSYSMFRLEVKEVMNVGVFESGIPYMFALFFFAFFMAIGGILYTRYNTFIIGLIGTGFIVGGFILSSFATTILHLTLTYGVLVGIGVGILYGLPLRVVAGLNHERSGLLTGIVLIGFGLSPVIFAPLIGSFIINLGLSTTFLALSGIYFVIITPLMFYLSKQDLLEKTTEKTSFTILKNKDFQMLYILFFIGTFIGLTLIGLTGSIGTKLVSIDANDVAFYIGLFAVFNGLGRPLFGSLHDRYGLRLTAIISFISMALFSVFIYVFSSSLLVYIVVFIVYLINFGGWLSLAPSATMNMFGKKNYSKNYGLMYTAYAFGAIIGNSITGVLADAFNLRVVYIIVFVISLIGLYLTNKHFAKQITTI